MIQRWMEQVCSQAGWAIPAKNTDNVYRFRLEPDIIVDASSPDERTLILGAKVTSLDGFNRDDMLKKTATAVLPRTFKDSATISFDPAGQDLFLHCVITLGALRVSDFSGVMESFLNDLAFYRSL
jgi:hypothetical protein